MIIGTLHDAMTALSPHRYCLWASDSPYEYSLLGPTESRQVTPRQTPSPGSQRVNMSRLLSRPQRGVLAVAKLSLPLLPHSSSLPPRPAADATVSPAWNGVSCPITQTTGSASGRTRACRGRAVPCRALLLLHRAGEQAARGVVRGTEAHPYWRDTHCHAPSRIKHTFESNRTFQ